MHAFSEPAWIAIAVAAITGIPATLAAVLGYLAHRETRPNSGSSMRDSLNLLHEKLDGHVKSTDARFNAIEEHLTNPSDRTGAQLTLLRSPAESQKAGSQ
jgi:hypothetical protein